MAEIKIEKEAVNKFETKYVFDVREFKGSEYVVMGKGFTPKDSKEEYVKGLWVNKNDFAKVAPAIVELIKQHAPEALK